MAEALEKTARGASDVWDEVSFYGEDYFVPFSGPEGGFRSFFGFWFGGMSAPSGVIPGQPIIKRISTVPFLGGSLRRGGW